MQQPTQRPPTDEYIDSLFLKTAASNRLSGEELDSLIVYVNALRKGNGRRAAFEKAARTALGKRYMATP